MARQMSGGIENRLAEFDRKALGGRGPRLQRLPWSLIERSQAEPRMDVDYVPARRVLERGDCT
jgi:hypothetical protein